MSASGMSQIGAQTNLGSGIRANQMASEASDGRTTMSITPRRSRSAGPSPPPIATATIEREQSQRAGARRGSCSGARTTGRSASAMN